MRVALYARVSSEEQAERETIQNQIDFYRRYLDLYGKNLLDAGMYLDDGVSGMIAFQDRPGVANLLEDAIAKKFDQVLVWKLDRLGRDPRIILNAVHDLTETGASIKSMTEPFETGTPYGDFMLTVLAGVAGLERSVFLERSLLGLHRRAREGKWLGGIVPYGYRVNDEGYLEVCEEPLDGVNLTEAGVVRLMYECVADRGWSTIKLAHHFNAMGIPTAYAKDGRLLSRGQRKERTANIWRPGRIRNMLINPTYKGEHVWGRRTKKAHPELVERKVPAIVDAETWERARETLRRNQILANRNAKSRYLLRGLIRCYVCGLHYHGVYFRNTPSGEAVYYYICGGKSAYRGPLRGKCTNRNVPVDWVEELVWGQIVEFIRHPKSALKKLREELAASKPQAQDLSREIENLEVALAQKNVERQRVMGLYRRGTVRLGEAEVQLQEIDREEAALKESLASLRSKQSTQEISKEVYASAETLLRSLRSAVAGEVPWEKKREIVEQLVKEVVVGPHETTGGRWCTEPLKVTIRYRFV
jgi:site-specific DNA recombinase